MYTEKEFKNLTSQYGWCSSWATWNMGDRRDTSIIGKEYKKCNSKIVVLGLNISKKLKHEIWSNFHGGKFDRRLKYAFNNNKYRGIYLTDIFKGVETVSVKELRKKLTDKIIKENVEFFTKEMKNVKISNKTRFILIGKDVEKYFEKNFKENLKNIFKINDNNFIKYRHYSDFGVTDEEWVCGLWNKLKIEQNYKKTKNLYK